MAKGLRNPNPNLNPNCSHDLQFQHQLLEVTLRGVVCHHVNHNLADGLDLCTLRVAAARLLLLPFLKIMVTVRVTFNADGY